MPLLLITCPLLSGRNGNTSRELDDFLTLEGMEPRDHLCEQLPQDLGIRAHVQPHRQSRHEELRLREDQGRSSAHLHNFLNQTTI